MNRTLVPAVAVVIVVSMLIAPRGTVMATNGVLTAWPPEGRSGSAIFLSGSGLPPGQRLTILMACPNWFAPHVWEYDNAKLQTGPRTDKNGNFVAHRLESFTLHILPSSSCRIYTSDQVNAFGPDIPALYTIVASGDSLQYADTHIPIAASAQPTRVRAGYLETITIRRGWPGALTDVTVTVPGAKTFRQEVQLDQQGRRTLRIRVPTGAGAIAAAVIRVHCKLGPYLGDAKAAHFTVVH